MRVLIIVFSLFSFSSFSQEMPTEFYKILEQIDDVKLRKKESDEIVRVGGKVLDNLSQVPKYEPDSLKFRILRRMRDNSYRDHYELNSELTLLESRYQNVINQIYRAITSPLKDSKIESEFFNVESIVTTFYTEKESQFKEFSLQSEDSKIQEVKGVIEAIFDPIDLENLENKIRENISLIISEHQNVSKESEKELLSLNSRKDEISAQIDKKQNLTESLFNVGFPIFIGFILVLYLAPFFLLKIKPTNPIIESIPLLKNIYDSGVLVETITVFLLSSTILLLGLTDKIKSDILGTLLGGISGYVLGKGVSKKYNK